MEFPTVLKNINSVLPESALIHTDSALFMAVFPGKLSTVLP
jgi:hypothetical protein